MEWMLMPLRRYADFSGRSRRKEYWMFTLLLVILYAIIATVAVVTGSLDSAAGLGFSMFGGISLILLAVVGLALIVPSIAVQVRRFHDQDRSGWFVLLNFITLPRRLRRADNDVPRRYKGAQSLRRGPEGNLGERRFQLTG